MSIKIKNRDPKSTDFSPNDIIVNVKDGTLFYKSDKALFKLQGDNLNTPTTENSFESSINITAFSGSFQYITASVIDVDAETIRFGGTSLARTDVQNLKTGLFNHITASGNISASGYISAEKFTRKNGKVRLESESGQELEIASTRDVRIFIDSNNDDDTNRFEIQSNTNSANDSNIVMSVEQDGSTFIKNHVTASGNISASGTGSFGMINGGFF